MNRWLPIPAAVERAAAGFGLDRSSCAPLGGRSGSAWSDGDVVLRVGEHVADEVAGRLGRGRPPSRFPGFSTGSSATTSAPSCSSGSRDDQPASWPWTARPVPQPPAALVAELHDALAKSPAPPGLRDAPGADCRERRLLHLDLHPFNVLVDDGGEPTGVIDWANAAAGDPELDRARTWSLLTLDPAARDLGKHPGWATLTEHWLQAGRMHALSAAARIWACRFMLADLAARHSRAELAHIRRVCESAARG